MTSDALRERCAEHLPGNGGEPGHAARGRPRPGLGVGEAGWRAGALTVNNLLCFEKPPGWCSSGGAWAYFTYQRSARVILSREQ